MSNVTAAVNNNTQQQPQPSPRRSDSSLLNDYRLAGEMIDSVRNAASISHEKSQIAVQKVIESLQVNCHPNIRG